MLDNLLNKQFKLALWNFILGFAPIVGIVVFIAVPAWSYSDQYGPYGYYNPTGLYIAVALWAIGGISQFVIWIIGIINAVKINSITGDSTLLIVFAIIPMWFGLLIVSVIQRNKFRGTSSIAPRKAAAHTRTATAAPRTTSFEDKLKASFMDGVITSSEYEKKLKAHKDNTKK